jgi:hypothetical protein
MTVSAHRRVLLTLAVAATASTALAGCGRSSTPTAARPGRSTAPAASPYPRSSSTASPAVPMPDPASVDGSNVDAVALMAVRALKQSDTAVDADPNDTARRAIGWLTPTFAGQVRAYPPIGGPGAQWNTWAAHQAYLDVTTSLAGEDHPPDTATTAYRQVVAVLRPVGRDGWHGDPVRQVVFASLARIDGRWRLDREQTT